MSKKDYKSVNYSHKFKYKKDKNFYEFQLVHKKRRWWWLLLLLLLLFVRCSHDLTVTCVDADSKMPIEGVTVGVDYTAHFLLKDWKPLVNEPYDSIQVTDEDGKAEFKDLKCSIYSYVFYCLSKVNIQASSECYEPIGVSKLFHFTRNVTLDMKGLATPLHVRVIDDETEEPIPHAAVVAKFEMEKSERDTLYTNATGETLLENARLCDFLTPIKASAYGYNDTAYSGVSVREHVEKDLPVVLRLRCNKANFSYTVKNSVTKEPVPDALAVVTLTTPYGKERGVTKTRIDGKGKGYYEAAALLAVLDIEASKEHYKPGRFDWTPYGEPHNVEAFNRLSEEERVIWLEPEPFLVQFQDVDSLTLKPIPGVKNIVKVYPLEGGAPVVSEAISNSNGYFDVRAREGERIEVYSEKYPNYTPKTTVIAKFEKEEQILLSGVNCGVEIVMCIDNTGSMGSLIGMVRNNAMSFYNDLKNYCADKGQNITEIRVRVVSFGDLQEKPISMSPSYIIPDQSSNFRDFVSKIDATGGGDEPESGLEAVAMALQNKWSVGGPRVRHIVLVYTDASAHPFSPMSSEHYPMGMPLNLDGLKSTWLSMPENTRRMVLFAPSSYPWNDMSSWPNVYHKTSELKSVLSGKGYTEVLDAISKSL